MLLGSAFAAELLVVGGGDFFCSFCSFLFCFVFNFPPFLCFADGKFPDHGLYIQYLTDPISILMLEKSPQYRNNAPNSRHIFKCMQFMKDVAFFCQRR